MPETLADLAFPALWTFQRGDEVLTVLREVIDDRATLTISDARGTNRIPFDHLIAMTIYQADLERQLVDDGWTLAAFAPDLRNGHERRKNPRTGHDRRRPA